MPESDYAKIIGEALILASIQTSLGSVEMSSKFSVMNFSKDQMTLDGAMKSLREYCIIATIWMIGTCAVLYSQFGVKGLIAGLVSNGIVLTWIIVSYMICFRAAAKKYNLTIPNFFKAQGC